MYFTLVLLYKLKQDLFATYKLLKYDSTAFNLWQCTSQYGFLQVSNKSK